jgi:hypothetical protein
MSLRNVSSRDVLDYALDLSGGSSRDTSSSIATGSRSQPALAHGATRKERFRPSRTGTSGILVAAAVFSDGSYEGDRIFAARLQGLQTGNETQQRRMGPVIERIIQDPALDDATRVTLIQGELMKLSNNPDSAIGVPGSVHQGGR